MKTIYMLFIISFTLFSFSCREKKMDFSTFLSELASISDNMKKSEFINAYMQQQTIPVVERDSIHFLYRGQGQQVAIPGEMNRWDPSQSRMERLRGTDLFFRSERLSPEGRLEYKIWVDSSWMLDPLNKRIAPGGFGENSDVWMSAYAPPTEIEFDPNIPHGSIDTLYIESRHLNRTHPVFVYRPVNTTSMKELPSVYVLDGQDYLTFARMNNILDNLIAARKIVPVTAIFIEPRTDPNNFHSNHRMTDYAASDTFIQFLEKELIPFIASRYPVDGKISRRLIMGESMGGLMATFTVLKQPDLFVNAAAQSPAFLQADGAVSKLLKQLTTTNVRVWIDTGTINDTQTEAAAISALLWQKGATVQFSKYPEGHNWSNWRARIKNILEYFFPME